MFDDQPTQAGAGVPGNLPVGEPEDLFGGVDEVAPASTAAPAATPEPVSAPAAPSALDAGVLRAKADTPPEPPPVPRPAAPASTPTPRPVSAPSAEAMGRDMSSYQIKSPSIGRGIMTVIVVAVVVAILGGGGWWVYTSFIQPAAPAEELGVDVPTVPTDSNVVDNQTDTGGGLDTQLTDDQVLFGEPIDRDADGIDDTSELRIGTDPNNWDTDGDELADGDEVDIWKTDPLNPDTDGDSYFDGAEVRSGYSPTGPGKIFEAPTNTST